MTHYTKTRLGGVAASAFVFGLGGVVRRCVVRLAGRLGSPLTTWLGGGFGSRPIRRSIGLHRTLAATGGSSGLAVASVRSTCLASQVSVHVQPAHESPTPKPTSSVPFARPELARAARRSAIKIGSVEETVLPTSARASAFPRVEAQPSRRCCKHKRGRLVHQVQIDVPAAPPGTLSAPLRPSAAPRRA